MRRIYCFGVRKCVNFVAIINNYAVIFLILRFIPFPILIVIFNFPTDCQSLRGVHAEPYAQWSFFSDRRGLSGGRRRVVVGPGGKPEGLCDGEAEVKQHEEDEADGQRPSEEEEGTQMISPWFSW